MTMFISTALLGTSCMDGSYEEKPYSSHNTWPLLAVGGQDDDRTVVLQRDLERRAVAVHFYYRPDQVTAFPLVGDYRDIDASHVVTNRVEVSMILAQLRCGLSIDVPSKPLPGTLHIVVEYAGYEDRAAYFILYCSSPFIAPVFRHDSAGFSCGSFFQWLVATYPHIFSTECVIDDSEKSEPNVMKNVGGKQ
jgi:hypothetical protein